MTQIATVEKILDTVHAEISVPRKTACGHDCAECAGCGVTGAAVYAKAVNAIGARPGQKVVVESDTNAMLGIVALVYLTPLVTFLVGYLLGTLLNAGELTQNIAAGIGFALGIIPAVAYDRRIRARGGFLFRIVRLF